MGISKNIIFISVLAFFILLGIAIFLITGTDFTGRFNSSETISAKNDEVIAGLRSLFAEFDLQNKQVRLKKSAPLGWKFTVHTPSDIPFVDLNQAVSAYVRGQGGTIISAEENLRAHTLGISLSVKKKISGEILFRHDADVKHVKGRFGWILIDPEKGHSLKAGALSHLTVPAGIALNEWNAGRIGQFQDEVQVGTEVYLKPEQFCSLLNDKSGFLKNKNITGIAEPEIFILNNTDYVFSDEHADCLPDNLLWFSAEISVSRDEFLKEKIKFLTFDSRVTFGSKTNLLNVCGNLVAKNPDKNSFIVAVTCPGDSAGILAEQIVKADRFGYQAVPPAKLKR